MTGIASNLDLSIIIVNYKTPHLLDICIGSVLKYTENVTYEIIIVDNFSEDDSEHQILKKYDSVRWLNMPANEGTPRAWNMGIRNSFGKYILILNSDIELFDNAIAAAVDKYKQLELKNKTGLFCSRLKGYDGIIQFNSNLFFPGFGKYIAMNPLLNKFFHKQTKTLTFEEKLDLHNTDHESSWIGIAFGLFNADICRKEGLFFDEDFFMYSDEVEWCYRLKKKGYHHFFFPACTVFHLNTGSSPNSAWRNGQILISEWLFLRKTKGWLRFLLFMLLLWFNLLIIYLMGFKNIFAKNNEFTIRKTQEKLFYSNLIIKYGFKILFNYGRKPSSSLNFLKYDI